MKSKQDDPRRPDDAGTILEPIESLRALYGQAAAAGLPRQGTIGQQAPTHTMLEPLPSRSESAGKPPAVAHARVPRGTPGAGLPAAEGRPVGSGRVEASNQRQEGSFLPALRPATPRLTLLDDGETTEGEVVRLREQITMIGRSEGHIRLPHDPLVSSKHAEIVREGTATASRWILRDVGSSNGTFVCCSRTVLRPDRLIILGSRRYRFRPAQTATPATAVGGAPATMMLDTRHMLEQSFPMLVETTQPESKPPIKLTTSELSVGRPDCGNQIELDDPLIAAQHAIIRCNASGEWSIEAKPSKNGIWVQITSLRLSELCRFQCGEQRFLFVI